MKNYNEKSGKVYFLEVNVQNLEKLYGVYNDLPFLPETTKNEKNRKLVCR